LKQVVDEINSDLIETRYRNEDAKDPPPESSWGKLLPWVPRGALVLEVGCAQGSFSSALRKHRGCRVVGVEIDSGRAETARAHCDQVIVGDVAQLIREERLPKDVDTIIASDVIEHLSEPLVTLRGLGQLLRRGGLILASIPNVAHLSVLVSLAEGSFPRSREGLLDYSHLQFYGEADVLSLFKDAGYAVRIVDRVKVDPRLTEFQTKLAAVPESVLEYFDNNPNSTTYQFIVRAVPLAWATESDGLPSNSANRASHPFRNRLAEELAETQGQVRQYHDLILSKDAELKKYLGELANYHQLGISQRMQLEALHDKLAEYDRALQSEKRQYQLLETRSEELVQDLERKLLAEVSVWADSLTQGLRSRAQQMRPLGSHEKGRLRVLFVTNRLDAPYRYRCIHACEQLRESGVLANALELSDPQLLEALPGYSIVILFRLQWSSQVEQLLRSARQNGAKIGFDIDDLVFQPTVESMIPFLKRLPGSTVNEYRAQFAGLLATLREADFCIAATPTIAKYLLLEDKPTIVHPNLLSRTHLNIARLIYRLRPALIREELIGYMSGSHTHDGDLASVAPAIHQLLQSHPNLRIAICGHVGLPALLKPLRSRIIRILYQDHRVYPWLMARCRAVIAPLEVVNDFTNAKSALKVFEAGVFGVPVVASPAEPYREAIHHGETGFLASSTQEWVAALSSLIDRDASLRLGAEARTLALREYSPDAHPSLLAQSLLPHCGEARGLRPGLLPLEPRDEPRRTVIELGGEAARLAIARSELLEGAEGDDSPTYHSLQAEAQEADGPAARWIACAGRDGNKVVLDGKMVGCILADRERPLVCLNEDIVPSQRGVNKGTAFRVIGSDPMFLIDNFPAMENARCVLVEMKASSTFDAVDGQLFFSPRGRDFSEQLSLRFPVAVDGRPRTYVLPLSAALQKLFRSGAKLRFRFDPLDRPGEIEVSRVAILSERPGKIPATGVREKLAQRFVHGTGVEIGALQNPMPPPAGATVRYLDHLTLDQARASFPELGDLKLVDPSIIDDAETLQSVKAQSQDFVIAGEVLEHTRDPIGALRNWLRVLKPGRFLYFSVPDRSNPFDQHREVTSFEHLLADHHSRATRSAEDERHYWDWTSSAHREMSLEEQKSFNAKLLAEGHGIHFHVFDRDLLEQLLAHVCPISGARTVELHSNRIDSSLEHIAILQRLDLNPAAATGVDIVVPIYNARELTRRCVESVLKHATGDWRLVLVDDASSDPGVRDDLRKVAESNPRVRLLVNEVNRGFVKTANRGMREAQGRDVLLLNSDTEVFSGFLEKLRECAHADAKTGVVSPFSNNATICSIPEFGKDNPIPAGYTAESYAELVAACSKRRRPEIVTAVGFCMYIKSSLIKDIGLFDESYGRGFGEENDFCERAKKAGFSIRLCDDVFVLHQGKASFGEEGRSLESTNARLLEGKQPGYHAAVATFFETNPLAPLHSEIQFQTRRLGRGRERAILYILHASPFVSSAGGTELHLRDLLCSLALPRALVAYPDGQRLTFAEVIGGDVERPFFSHVELTSPAEGFCIHNEEVVAHLLHAIRLFGISGVHIQHLLRWPIELGVVLRSRGIKTVYSSHDYYCVCPSWNLFDHRTGVACQCDSLEDSSGCIPALVEKTGVTAAVDLVQLRRQHRQVFTDFLGQVDGCIFPSQAARNVVSRHLAIPLERTRVIEHGSDLRPSVARQPRGERLRVAIVGEVAFPIKGADNYVELVRRSAGRDLEWHFFGTTSLFGFEERISAAATVPVRFHGRYDRSQIVDRLREEGIDLCVLLPKAEETFSYVLSEVVIAGVPVVALDRGSLRERIERGGFGIAVGTLDDALQRLAHLADDRSELNALAERARAFRHPSILENAAAIRGLYIELGMMPAGDRLPAADALEEIYLRSDTHREFVATAARRPARTSLPAPRYQGSGWYPAFAKVKPFVPQAVRQLGRKALVRLEEGPTLKLDPARVGCIQCLANLKIVRRGFRNAEYQAEGSDPQIVFSTRSLPPNSVNRIRFRFRRPFNGPAYAQLFWRHSAEENFSEDNSAKVELGGKPNAWHEYTFRLDDPTVQAKWNTGQDIFQLRFDPLNVPGTFEMGPLEVISSTPAKNR
jgi:GT2 family glycosyltransferase/glycosyltransferase involved in cell wall biosynthesis/2-polyprenyl-3-methyl-5-hydroxy-6-metoxy-1,4-benzoquinol methylase